MLRRSRDLIDPRVPFGATIPGIIEHLELKFVPFGRRIKARDVMKNLAGARNVIAVVLEVARERYDVWKVWTPVLLVVIDAGCRGSLSRK